MGGKQASEEHDDGRSKRKSTRNKRDSVGDLSIHDGQSNRRSAGEMSGQTGGPPFMMGGQTGGQPGMMMGGQNGVSQV